VNYRVTVENRDKCESERFEVEAPDVSTAILRAGMEVARNSNPVLPPEVVRVEVPAGWVAVKLP
jgi:hypothetical protein